MSHFPRICSSLSAEQLASAAASIRRVLTSLETGVPISRAELAQVFAEVQRISELRTSSQASQNCPDCGAAFDVAVADYRSALEAWGRQLPRLYGWLLAERHQLELRQQHACGVRTWFDAQKQTC